MALRGGVFDSLVAVRRYVQRDAIRIAALRGIGTEEGRERKRSFLYRLIVIDYAMRREGIAITRGSALSARVPVYLG